MTADQIIARLGLEPHPEGGHYRQTWSVDGPGRALSTCIYFLLAAGERSHWHRVDADELWLFHGGAALDLLISKDADGPAVTHRLSGDLDHGIPQAVVPKGHWQAARTSGDWSLVSCVVSPGFQFDGFELAPAGFDISPAR